MQVINKRDYVKRKIRSEQLKIGLGIVLIMAGFFGLALGFVAHFLFFGLGVILFVFGGMMLINRASEVSIWKAGLEGQMLLPKALMGLPDEYTLINNVSLKDKNCDIDHVIVSPKCIFAIESKHYNGEIYGQGDDWGYMKRGRAGGFYKGHIGNPAKQIKRSVWELKQRLDEELAKKGIDTSGLWVEPLVVFTNPTTTLKITDSSVKALLLKDLKEHIEKSECKTAISLNFAKAIVDVLKAEQ